MDDFDKYAFVDFVKERTDDEMDLAICEALMKVNGDLEGFNDYLSYTYGYCSSNSFEDNCVNYIMDETGLDIDKKQDKKEFEEEYGQPIDLGYNYEDNEEEMDND